MKRWIAIAAAVLVGAAVLVIAGVGGSDSETVPSSTVADAAAATSRTGFRLAIDAKTSIPGSDRTIPMTGSGAIDPVHKRGKVTIDISKTPGLPVRGTRARIDEVIVGKTIYMQTPFMQNLPGDKSWIRIDLDRVQPGLDLDSSGGGLTSDPTQLLDQLRATSGSVERVGRERVRGVATTHYRATVDLRRYPRLVPPARRAAARRSVEQLIRFSGAARFPEEVWIDGRQRIRRFRIAYEFQAPGAPRLKIAMSEDLYDFGAPVRVTVPSDDDALDITELTRRRLQGNSQ